jgi:hypothetical protein
MKPWERLLYAIGALGIALGIGIGLWAIGAMIWPYHGLIEGRLTVKQPTVKADDTLTYKFAYCVDLSLPVPLDAQRELILESDQAVTYLSPPVNYTIEQRCESRLIRVGIPGYVPPGRYRLRKHTVVHPNAFQDVAQSWTSNTFEVVK